MDALKVLNDNFEAENHSFLYGQVLRHIIYHFDPGDLSRISNLPCNYNEELETLERIIRNYFL